MFRQTTLVFILFSTGFYWVRCSNCDFSGDKNIAHVPMHYEKEIAFALRTIGKTLTVNPNFAKQLMVTFGCFHSSLFSIFFSLSSVFLFVAVCVKTTMTTSEKRVAQLTRDPFTD